MRLRPLFRLASRLTGHSFRLLPRGWRFPVAKRLALAFAPLLRRTPLYARRPSALDGPREDALRLFWRAMNHTGARFDPVYAVIGGEHVPPGGAIVVSGHFLLNGLLARWLYDRGERICVLAGDVEERRVYPGIGEPMESMPLGPASLMKVRTRLREGFKILGYIDSTAPMDNRAAVETPAGTRYISPSMIELAATLDVPLLFSAAHFDEDDRLVLAIDRPRTNDPYGEFCEFYRAHTAAIRR